MKKVIFLLLSMVVLFGVGACSDGGSSGGDGTLTFDACASSPGTYTGTVTQSGNTDTLDFSVFGSCDAATGSIGASGNSTVTVTCGGEQSTCTFNGPGLENCDGASGTSAENSVDGLQNPDPSWQSCAAGTQDSCQCDPTGTVTFRR